MFTLWLPVPCVFIRQQGGPKEAAAVGAVPSRPGPAALLPQFRLLPECSLASAYAFALEPRHQRSISCCISAAFEPLISVFSMQPSAGAGECMGWGERQSIPYQRQYEGKGLCFV
jgi:hypothetical protein